MVEDVYRRLAHKLDEIPNGFPETESGIELRLLTKIFTGCGVCVERFQVGALSTVGSTFHVSIERCIGCGLRVTSCPSGAVTPFRRDDVGKPPTPFDREGWMKDRMENRGISLQEIL